MADVSTATQNDVQPQQASLTGFATAPQAPADTIQKVTRQTVEIGQYSFPDEPIKYFMTFGMADWEFGAGSSTRQIPILTDSIRLPLPDSLHDLQTVNWERSNLLEKSFAIAAALIGGAGAIVAGASGQSAKTAGEILGRATVAGGAATVTGGAVAAAGVATRLLGYAPNQFITILLNGPEYKQHNFSWTLAPKTPIEARNLKNIIQKFNNSMAPYLAQGGLFWKFPKIFWIEFSPNPDYLFRFKPAVLTNFMVDYSGGHVPSFLRNDSATNGDNPPEAVHIQMQFLEIEYWQRDQFVDGGFTAAGAAAQQNIAQQAVNAQVNQQLTAAQNPIFGTTTTPGYNPAGGGI